MATRKTLYLLSASLTLSFLINIVVVYNTLSFRGYLKGEYLTSVKGIVDSMTPSNELKNRYLILSGIGQGFASGAALDQQFRIDNSKPFLHHRIIQEITFAVFNDNYSDEEKYKVLSIYYKHLKRKNLPKAYIDIRTELMEQRLDHGVPSAEQV